MKTGIKVRYAWFHGLLNRPELNNGPLPWSIIAVSIILFFIPFNLPGKTVMALGGYATFSFVPVLVSAQLRARRGALVACSLIAIGMVFYNMMAFGFAWPAEVMNDWVMGNIGLLILGLVAGQFRTMSNKLTMTYHKLAVAHEALQKQALTDPLTGLPNHRAVIEQLEKECERTRRFHRPLSLVFFDGDRFKNVNDTYGHAVGDTVLCELGARVGDVLRGGDIMGRLGGEEFVVVLPETDATQASDVAERLRAVVAAHPLATRCVDGGINFTISVGIATYPEDGKTVSELLNKADQAMYWAKRLGRNQVRTATEAQRASYSALLDSLVVAEEGRDETQANTVQMERLQRAYSLGTIYSLMRMIEVRDSGISRHSHTVSDMATAIAQYIGLEQKAVFALGAAALLHDIGKIAIPDVVLYKAGPLSSTERTILQQHSELGAQILEISPFLQELIPAVRYHHEHWDGKGYPDHLAGQHIPLEARIIAVAEAYDAIIMDRPYCAGRSPAEALAELQRCAGTQFDPEIVHAFAAVLASQQEQEQPAPVVVSRQEEEVYGGLDAVGLLDSLPV